MSSSDVLNPLASVFVEAHAGCGKTYLLVQRFLKLVEAGCPPQKILCITYTRAVGEVMRERILESMYSSESLKEVLDSDSFEGLGDLRIGTLHSFCHGVLKAFDPTCLGKRLLEDKEEDELLLRAQRLVLENATQEGPLWDTAQSLGDEKLLFGILKTALREGMSAFMPLEFFEDELSKALKLTTRDPEVLFEKYKRARAPFLDFLTRSNESLSSIREYETALKEGLRTKHLLIGANIFLTKQGTARKRLASEAIYEEQRHFLAYKDAQDALKIFDVSRSFYLFGGAILEAFKALKEQEDVLTYEDILARTLELFKNTPSTLYELSYDIRHILVDEAQDLTRQQWDILRFLREEFYAHSFQADQARTLFVVADPKQSIFSFQGAHPELFFDEMQEVERCAQLAGAPFARHKLDSSFRSAPRLLHFVDRVCNLGVMRPSLLGHDLIVHRGGSSEEGLLEVWPLDPGLERAFQGDMTDVQHPLVVRILLYIKDWMANNSDVRILVLFQTKGVLMRSIERALNAHEIPFWTPKRLTLSESLEAQDIFCFLRFILNPNDDFVLASLLKTAYINLEEEHLYELAHQRTDSLWHALGCRTHSNPYGKVFRALSLLLEKRELSLLSPLLSLKIVHTFMMRTNDIHFPIHEIAFNALLERALVFEEEVSPSLELFLAWTHMIDVLERPGALSLRAGVTLSTVHSAKGLEADVVFMPQTTRVPRQQEAPYVFFAPTKNLPFIVNAPKVSNPLLVRERECWYKEQKREYHRLLYVALTRAKKALYVGGVRPHGKLETWSWYALCAQALGEVSHPHQ